MYYLLLSQAFSSWYFSCTSNDRLRPGFKLYNAELSVLCVMFQVQLFFVVNLLNVFLVWLPNFSLSFSLLFEWLQLLLAQSYIIIIIIIIIISMFLLCNRISFSNSCLRSAERDSETLPYVIVYSITSSSKIVKGMITRFILIDFIVSTLINTHSFLCI